MATVPAMRKEDFVKLVVAKFEGRLSSRDVDIMINGIFGAIVEALQQNRKVKIYRFGSFVPAIRGKRQGRNPHSGEAIEIPAKGVVKFSASPILKSDIESALVKTKSTAAKAAKPTEKKSAAPAKAVKKSDNKSGGKATAKKKSK